MVDDRRKGDAGSEDGAKGRKGVGGRPPRPAAGDLPVAEIGGGAAAGALLGRLVGGGRKSALLGAAVGAVAGTAVGLVRGGVLGTGREPGTVEARDAAFGPAPRPDPAGKPGEVGSARRAGRAGAAPREKARDAAPGGRSPSPRRAPRPKTPKTDYSDWTKAELYEEAKKRDISGRSRMSKAELLKALGGA